MAESKPKTTYTKGTLYQLSCDILKPDRNQPRKHFDPGMLQDLVNSIKDKGVLQPILFREDKDNLFIVAGERRLQASKKAGLETIPAILVEGNHDEIALIENILREDLTAVEFAESLERIKTEHDYTHEQLTGIIGKAKSTVSDILSLTKLPKEIRDDCRSNPKIPRQALMDIVRKKKREKGMITAYEKLKKQISSPKKQRGPKGKRTFETRYTAKFDKIKTFMTDIDLGKMETAERNSLVALIDDLKKSADGLLEKIKAAPAAVKAPSAERDKPKKETPKKKATKTVAKVKGKIS